ncbi:MAG: transcriptional repressor [Chloroflexi bacterium]|nr:transcriptional repressor [Chloroflexota bacterium]
MSESISMASEAPSPSLLEVLESGGHRSTAPRRAIASLLEKKQEGFSADALSDELPSVGRATVYRTINLFLEAGAICKLATMNGSHIYSICGVGHHHHHTVCVECGAVDEFRADAVERLISELSAEIPGEIVSHRLELFVNCHSCPEIAGG